MVSVYIILSWYFMINVNYRIMKEVNILKNTAASLDSCQILPRCMCNLVLSQMVLMSLSKGSQQTGRTLDVRLLLPPFFPWGVRQCSVSMSIGAVLSSDALGTFSHL